MRSSLPSNAASTVSQLFIYHSRKDFLLHNNDIYIHCAKQDTIAGLTLTTGHLFIFLHFLCLGKGCFAASRLDFPDERPNDDRLQPQGELRLEVLISSVFVFVF